MRFFRTASALLLCAALAPLATADEGMWMPQQVPQLAERLKALGFTGDPAQFADLTGFPMGAVVSLGGCTASFVSDEGLIVTNHHCVQGALQYNSTPERNLMIDGFLAKTREEELPVGPGSRVYVTTSVTDVTAEIRGKLPPKIADAALDRLLERRVKARVAACEQGGGKRCVVAAFFGGRNYFEIAQMEIRDVRLVYAPAAGIGNFGGETDNWRFPRHTGDWSFYRAYVAKDGSTATFSKENVPFKPKHRLRVSPKGASPGEVVFVAGYPGRTQRHLTFEEVREVVNWQLPRSIKLAEEQIALLEEISKGDKALALKAAGRLRGLNNGYTNQRGVLEGLTRGGALALKEKAQQDLLAWIAADPARTAKYGGALDTLAKMQAESEKTRDRDAWLGGIFSSSTYLSAARTLHRLSIERGKKDDLEREAGYQQRDWGRLKEGQERMQRTLDPRLDRATFRWALLHVAGLPAEQRIAPIDAAAGLTPGMAKADAEKAIDGWLDKLYAGTKMGELEFRMGLFEKPAKEVAASTDSFVALAVALHPMLEARQEAGRARDGAYARVRPVYMDALIEQAGGLVAPDANSTLRVTYGVVKGVDGKDGLWLKPQTTLKGIEQKHTGEGEFDAPDVQLHAIQELRSGKTTPYLDPKLGDVPLNFLSTVDTTGGNSGSPTLNAKGEVVGLLFDGTYDSVSSNYLYEPVGTRSIHVDSRYMLWTMTEVDGASHLVEEMNR
ncbi:MAG: S46 family peptidase [Vicinamibacteria bacterium]|nr:S46 family peptidase [Vicinamibacteria bacterium]